MLMAAIVSLSIAAIPSAVVAETKSPVAVLNFSMTGLTGDSADSDRVFSEHDEQLDMPLGLIVKQM